MNPDVLRAVLAPPKDALDFESVEAWWGEHLAATAAYSIPIDRAIVGAARVEALGFAFAGGYTAALASLAPEAITREDLGALAATEGGSAHPRAIATSITRAGDHWILDGQKDFVTLGPSARTILVVAHVAHAPGEPEPERPALRVAKVDPAALGVTLERLPDAPFVPEIPHAVCRFEQVQIRTEDLLPGDGYARYLKPFRTVEDLHVHAALAAWLLAMARRASWPRALRERLTTALTASRALALTDPTSPEVQVALGGVLRVLNEAIEQAEPLWASAGGPRENRWARDRALLRVAGKAREQRLEVAWAHFEEPHAT